MRIISFCILLLFLTASIRAQIIYVNASATGDNNGTSWENGYTLLSPALAAAQANDTIVVARGIYTPHDHDTLAYFKIKPKVKLIGGFGGFEDPVSSFISSRDFILNETILSGDLLKNDSLHFKKEDNSYHLFYINKDSIGEVDASTVIDGFTLSGGNAVGRGNFQRGYGGAMYLRNVSPTLNNLYFTNNSAFYGGAIYTSGSSFKMNKSKFRFNRAYNTATPVGGAIYFGNGYAVLDSCIFEYNSAEGTSMGSGGAIYILGVGGLSAPMIKNSVFKENFALKTGMAGGQGGAMYIYSYGSSNYFQGYARPEVHNSLFCGNIAGAGDGNAIYVVCGHPSSYEYNVGEVTLSIFNTTIANHNNNVIFQLHNKGTTNIYYKNTILWNPLAANQVVRQPVASAKSYYQNSIIYGSFPSENWRSSLGENLGSVSQSDPLFVSQENCDFRLLKESPALGTGIDTIGKNIGWFQENEGMWYLDVYPGKLSGSIEISPNPADDYLYIKGDESAYISYGIYNLTGLLVSEGRYSSRIEVGSLLKGVYFLELKSQNTKYIHKFIKL